MWCELLESLTLVVNINIITVKSSLKLKTFFRSGITSSFVLFAIYLLYEASLISPRKELDAHLIAAAEVDFVRLNRIKF